VTAAPLPDGWIERGEWLVQAIDPRARLVRLVRMDAEAYRAASFLDDRLLSERRESRLCSLDEMVTAAAGVNAPPAAWIFHIGHVGSTLLSRLLGEIDGVVALREPRSLRDLAVAGKAEQPALAEALARLMARRSPGDCTVIVKATSFVSEYAPQLVEPGAAALLLTASPENYIAAILAGENSVMELAALHQIRTERLASRGIELRGFDLSDAQRAAAAWACEMTSLEAAADAMPGRRILWADFDAMLDDISGWLDRAARHFGLTAPAERIQELALGPLMRRYSKALEYDYSPSLRAELLADAVRQHGEDIDAAVAALRQAAGSAPLLRRALDRAEREC